MTPTRAWITYAIIRLAAFAIPFVIVLLLLPNFEYNWAVAAVVGAVVGLAVSEIFLHNQRIAIGEQLAERQNDKRDRRRAIDFEEDADLDESAPVTSDEPASGDDAEPETK